VITLTYVLLGLTCLGLLVTGGLFFYEKLYGLISLSITCVVGVTTMIVGFIATDVVIGPKTMEAVKKAAMEDPEVDAVVQQSLEDNKINSREFSLISQVYYEKTGKQIVNQED
jgi:hypothetical protein